MKNKTKTAFFLVLLSISSCNNSGNNCKKIGIPKKEFSWIKKYKPGDRILFRSDMENVDTLELVSKSIEYSPCNRFELGPNQYQTFSCMFWSEKLSHTKNDPSAGVTYSTQNSGYCANKMLIFAFGVRWVSADLEKDKSVATQKIKLDGIKDSIVKMHFDNSNYTAGELPAIEYFDWNKELGLIQYKTSENGETYKYWKKI